MLVTGCSSTAPGGNNATTTDTPTIAVQAPAPVVFARIAGEYPDPMQIESTKNSRAPVGACVNVGGTQEHSTLTVVDCDAPTSAFRVVERVETLDQCGDADLHYYQNGPDGQWAACLDYNWASDFCISVGSWEVRRTPCDDQTVFPRYKPTTVASSATDALVCGHGETGFTHPVRRFTVCVVQVA